MIKKDLKGSYLILWDEDNPPVAGYEQEMIRRNSIPGLLKCDILPSSSGTNLKYDITAMQSISSIYAGKQINYKDARCLMESVCQVIQGTREYILAEEGLIFDPDFIFYNYKEKTFRYCYYPGKETNVFTGIHALAEFLMDRVDHTDKAGTRQVYMFYELTNSDNYSVQEIYNLLYNGDNSSQAISTTKSIEAAGQEPDSEEDIEDNLEEESLETGKIKKKKRRKKSGKKIDSNKLLNKSGNKKIKPMDLLVWIASIGIVAWIIYDYFLKKYLRKINLIGLAIVVIALALLAFVIIKKRSQIGRKNKVKEGKKTKATGQK